MSSRKILITGARGFIGSHLSAGLRKKSIECLTYPHDITNARDADSFFHSNNPTDVVHLAGIHTGQDEELMRINAVGTQIIAKAAKESGCSRFVLLSSGAVYGNVDDPNGAREDDALRPANGYGLSKQLAEEIIRYYFSQNVGVFTIIRAGSVYGTGASRGIIPSMLASVRGEGMLSIPKTPVTRQFIHVEDLVGVLIKMLDNAGSEIFNAGSDDVWTLSDLAQLFVKKFNSTIKTSNGAEPYRSMRLNTDKIKKEYSFDAKKSVKDFIFSL